MTNFLAGLVAGFLANWIFGMVGRLLPSTWVRFHVRIGNPEKETGLAGVTWLVPVTISVPRWRKALARPLAEYLVAEVQLEEKWVKTQWERGDLAETMLRADAAMTAPCIVLSTLDKGESTWYVTYRASERDYALQPVESVRLRVVRTLDGRVADEASFPIQKEAGQDKLILAPRIN